MASRLADHLDEDIVGHRRQSKMGPTSTVTTTTTTLATTKPRKLNNFKMTDSLVAPSSDRVVAVPNHLLNSSTSKIMELYKNKS